ncbi:cutinase family protein [Catenulispora rubra]|uniref:cutinase family protein n=1 Tax=Catenulispora rubra TaxID=280293 RepID=UPI001892175F|nr:cutinase family protein [Catenulispora rubra]
MRILRRVPALVAAVGLLLGAAPSMAQAAPTQSTRPAQPSHSSATAKPNDIFVCTTYWVIGARGSGEGYDGNVHMGPQLNQYGSYAAGVLPAAQTTVESLRYDAVNIGPDYLRSEAQGVNNLTGEIGSIIANCPNTTIGLMGYSQGAQVVHDTVNRISSNERAHIGAVVMLADPESVGGASYTISVTTDGQPSHQHGGGAVWRSWLAADISSRSSELCLHDDPVCDADGLLDLNGSLATAAFNSSIHTYYGQCCGSGSGYYNFPQLIGEGFGYRLMQNTIGGPGGGTGPGPGGGPPGGGGGGGPQPVTSVYGLADGTVLQTSDTGRIYKMVGGAPIWLTSCAGGLCPNPLPTTQAVINAGPAVPANGATAKDEAGNVFKFAGGAPIHLASCAVGCGRMTPISAGSIVISDHMRPAPADGTTIVDEPGDVFKFVGSAPIHLTSCSVGCGSPVGISGASIAGLDHMRGQPSDGATAKDEAGNVFKFAGGAPIHLASCALGCGNPVPITAGSIVIVDHMRPAPADGTTIIDEPGDIFKFVGGAPIHLASCAVGCGSPVGITGASIAGLDHMLPVPADGATVIDEPGDVFRFAGGAPIHLSDCGIGCGAPVPISGAAIITNDHMRPVPADNAVVRTESGGLYKFAGGAPFYLTSCQPGGCGHWVQVNQWSVDTRDHMNTGPADGTNVVTVEDGTHYQAAAGEVDLADRCSAGGCGSAVIVNQGSITPYAQSTANRGPGFGELARYWNGSDHYTAAGEVPPGYRFEGPLGVLERAQVPGTVPLQACMFHGTDEFSSLDPNCEGQTVIGTLGFIYSSPPTDQPSLPFYRCLVASNGEHFDASDPNCEGQTTEHLLGYTIAYANYTRYSNSTTHWSSTRGLPAGFQPEWTFGMLPMTQQPGTVPLFSCMQNGTLEFTSTDANCEGQATVARIGFIWTTQPSGLPTVPIYRCLLTATGDHFDSFDSGCEGQHTEFQLGYLLARTQFSRTVSDDGHHRSTNGGALPSGFRLEGAFGYLSWTAEPGTQLLYSCQYAGGEFDSLDPTCAGYTVNGPLGYIWQQPPASVSSAEIFRCLTTTGDHFDSADPNCEGQHDEGPLGYVEQRI